MVTTDLICYLGLLQTITPLSILVSGRCMLYQNVYYMFSLSSPFERAWSQVFIRL
jgi:hypothetical protein